MTAPSEWEQLAETDYLTAAAASFPATDSNDGSGQRSE